MCRPRPWCGAPEHDPAHDRKLRRRRAVTQLIDRLDLVERGRHRRCRRVLIGARRQQRAVELGVRPGCRGGAVDVVAGQVGLGVRVPGDGQGQRRGLAVTPVGCAGAVVSIRQPKLVVVLMFPAASRARTAKVCWPSARAGRRGAGAGGEGGRVHLAIERDARLAVRKAEAGACAGGDRGRRAGQRRRRWCLCVDRPAVLRRVADVAGGVGGLHGERVRPCRQHAAP